MKAAEKFWDIFDLFIKIQVNLASLILLIAAGAVSVDVLMRYLFSITFSPIFEVTEFGLLWATFLGAPWLLKINGHVNVDLLTNSLSGKPKHILQASASFVSGLILLVMIIYSLKLTYFDFQSGFRLSGVLRCLKWPIEIIIPIGFFFLFIQNARIFVQRWTKTIDRR